MQHLKFGRRVGDPREGQGTCFGSANWQDCCSLDECLWFMELWETQPFKPFLNMASMRPDPGYVGGTGGGWVPSGFPPG